MRKKQNTRNIFSVPFTINQGGSDTHAAHILRLNRDVPLHGADGG